MEIQSHSAKQEFIHAAPTFADWATRNSKTLVTVLSSAVGLLLVAGVGFLINNSRNQSALEQFGSAMHIYESAVVAPGQPTAPGEKTYPTAADRARAANAAFAAVADKYSMTTAGRNAKYMAALTAYDMGQTATAESQLKDLSSSWSSDVAALSKLSLAQIYEQTGRASDAIALFDELTKKPTTTVPAGLAQLQLASLYESQGKTADAKKIYAQLKDKDAQSAVGEMAAQKLAAPSAE